MSVPWSSVINAQPMFDVLSQANQREHEGHYVARMEIGDTPGFRNDRIHELLTKYSQTPHRYSPSRGEDALIQAVLDTQWPSSAGAHDCVSIAPANFLITAALASITSQGDSVLVPDPGFPTYKLACDFLGLELIPYPVYPMSAGNFPELSDFIKTGSKIPRVVIVNNPSNPLGVAVEGEEIRMKLFPLIDLGIEVILDETYVNLVYEPINPIIKDIPAIRIRTFSKEQCAPGIRMGYALATKQQSVTISNFISLTISCAPRFIQLAVAEYLNSGEHIPFYKMVCAEMNSRFTQLEKLVPESMLLQKPNSAFYALIHTGDDTKSFEFLLQRNVSTCPGSKFGSVASGALRVSLAGDSGRFQRDLEMLSGALEEWFVSKNS